LGITQVYFFNSRITIEHLHSSHTLDFYIETKPGAKNPTKLKNFFGSIPWKAELDNVYIGQVMFVNEIKMEVIASKKNEGNGIISITGDFKEQRLVIIQKWEDTREQKLLGESKGRHQTKKSLLETQYLTNFEIQETDLNLMILGGVLLSSLLFSTQ
jgi:hypothetical protein